MVLHVVSDDVAEASDAVLLVERLADRVVEAGEAGDVHILDRGQLHLRERLAGRLLDRGEQPALARSDETDRGAAAARPSGAADAVDVGLRVDRDVVVDDVADALHVEAAGGDIRRHEDVELARPELLDCAFPLDLGDVAADRHGGVAARPQLLGERLRLVLGADEDDHSLEVLHLEDARERVDLLRIRHHQVPLARVRRSRGLVLDRDLFGVVQVLLGDPADLCGHRGREERDLFIVRGVGEDRLDVFGEAHLEHLVGLVEHEVLELGEVERALLEVIHDAAGRADHDMYAAAQCRKLHAVALAAVDRKDVHAPDVGCVLLERLADLQGEFAGRGEDERLGHLLRRVQPRQDRQGECGRLAGTGLGEADDIAPGEQQGDRRGLDGRRGLVADILERFERCVAEPEFREGDRFAGSFCLAGRCFRRRHGSTVVPRALAISTRSGR